MVVVRSSSDLIPFPESAEILVGPKIIAPAHFKMSHRTNPVALRFLTFLLATLFLSVAVQAQDGSPAPSLLWGTNGIGNLYPVEKPKAIAGDVVSVSAGGSHTLFIKADGTLWAVGDNTYGQLGIGVADSTARSTPMQVASGVAKIAAGIGHSMFIRTDGTLWAMGRNVEGQVGDGSTTKRTVPAQIAINTVVLTAEVIVPSNAVISITIE